MDQQRVQQCNVLDSIDGKESINDWSIARSVRKSKQDAGGKSAWV